MIISWGYLLNTWKLLLTALHGPSVWQSLLGRFPAGDTLFEVIANFLTPESLTFFNKSSPGHFWSYLRLLRAATTGTSPSWVTWLIYMYMNERVCRKLNRHSILQYQVTVHSTSVWLCMWTSGWSDTPRPFYLHELRVFNLINVSKMGNMFIRHLWRNHTKFWYTPEWPEFKCCSWKIHNE